MSRYKGPATLIVGALRYEVRVNLRAGLESSLKTWSGTIKAKHERPLRELAANVDAVLRLPDGERARVDPGGFVSGSTKMQISGTGPAPWWDARPRSAC